MKEDSPRKKFFLVFAFIALLLIGVYITRGSLIPLFFQPQDPEKADIGVNVEGVLEEEIEVVAKNLEIPWEIVFLSNNEMLVTQRTGELLYLLEGNVEKTFEIDDVKHIGEGGLLGMALHPEYESNSYLYLYLTLGGSSSTENAVFRYKFEDKELFDKTIILENIPGGRIHNGGRIAFGPDANLYITTGDAGETKLSQDINSLAGKILRITDEGEIPESNPFDNAVYSYGHRNPQGLAWDDEGALWSVEHGPNARDELNRIELGKNYGWPEIRGDEEEEGMETPVLHSGNDYTWAPSGMTYSEGRILFGGLRGQSIYEVRLENEGVSNLFIHFQSDFGRIRNVKKGPGGMIYVLTNNTDGRGSPESDDDKILRIDPTLFR